MTFIETLQLTDGRFQRPDYHIRRMRDTLRSLSEQTTDPAGWLPGIPEDCRAGQYKCRLVYNTRLHEISFTPYMIRKIETLRLVDGTGIRYDRKYADRSALAALKKGEDPHEDVLICIDEAIAETSYTNVLFDDGHRLWTPDSYLLNGTRRQYLLDQGVIGERRITVSDLPHYRRIHLINAMIAPGELTLPLSAIVR